MKNHPDKPRRLHTIFQSYDAPVYFITFNTYQRKALLASDEVHLKLIAFAKQAELKGAAFGRYVIMPDHIHCFVRLAPNLKIGTTIRLLKRSISSAISADLPHWQPGFFDHLLRHSDSYSAKWEYVRMNPVRAGLAKAPDDWPYQGEVIPIRY